MGLCPTMAPSTPFVQRPSSACRINQLPARKNWPWLQGTRSGFERLCGQVSQGRVGAVFGIEVSRLARNTVEWFQLLDLCRINDTILVEDSQV